VDPRLHQLQGKAEFVSDLSLLTELYRDKLSTLARHQAAARVVTQYDANNAYQYIINRDEAHLSWIAQTIADMGETIPVIDSVLVPGWDVGHAPEDAARNAITGDALQSQTFVDAWRTRIDQLTDARSQGLLRVILGETLEEKRFFEQALAGRRDLLGKRSAAGTPASGIVLPTRWIE
jgi:hypothetical protein